MNGSSFRQDPWFYPIVLCFVLVALLATTRINNFDLGTDLKTGQWILEHHAFPQKDTFTYTVNQNDYLDGKPLYQIVLYLIYRAFDYSGISLLNTLAILIVFFLLWTRLKGTLCPSWLTCFLLLASAIAMERRFFIRAEIGTWLLLSLTLLILDWRARGKRDLLWLLPVIQWTWVNGEGLFILGWFLMGSYGLSQWIQRNQIDKKLLKYALISIAVCLINPYGFKLVTLPFIYLTEFHNSGNSDLVSPLRFLTTQNLKIDWNIHLFIYFAFSAALWLAMALTVRKRKVHEWLLVVAFFGLSCVGYRNMPLFFLVTIPLLASCLSDLVSTPNNLLQKWNEVLQFNKKVPFIGALFLTLLCLRVLTNAYYISDRRMTRLGLGLDMEKVPVKAVEFLVQNHLDGRIINDMGMGDWLVWKGLQPVFIDGRQQVMGGKFYQEYQESFKRGGLGGLVDRYQPSLIALEYNDTVPWAVQLKFMPDWRLIYADGGFALYAEKDYAPAIPAFSFPDLLKQRNISMDLGQAIVLISGTQPSRWKTRFEGYYRPQTYPNELMSLGLLALHYEDYETAHSLFAESLRQAGGGYFEIFFNLGVANLRLKRYQLGKTCLQKALELKPGDPSTQQMLATLQSI